MRQRIGDNEVPLTFTLPSTKEKTMPLMGWTTVREVNKAAAREQLTRIEFIEKYGDAVCFLGMWDNPDAEVLVSLNMPIDSKPVGYVIL